MKTSWRIEMFGGLRACSLQGDQTLTRFETRKTAALLACLALHRHRAHPRDLLAEQLWPGEDIDAIRDRLRQALAALRRVLEPPDTPPGAILITNKADVQLDPEAVTTDVAEFEEALQAGARSDSPAETAYQLLRAVELYRGELLPGYYEEWIGTERVRLAEMHRSALSRLSAALAETGEIARAIDVARSVVVLDALREDAHCDLMRLYQAAGRTPEALRQYRELERILREDLGIAPSPATHALFTQIRTGTSTPTVSSSPSPSITPFPHVESQAPRLLPDAPPPARLAPGLEPDGGAVPLDSAYYIVRPTDAEFRAAIARHDSIVLVKGARQIGKTSLLARGLQQARRAGAQVVLTDLQKLGPEQMESAEALFRTFAEMIIDQLDKNIALDDVWNPRRGWNVNFERFLRREILGSDDASLVWGLDEVDRLFGYPFRDVVFGLFRSWHNERSLNPDGPWGRLTLTIAYATEAHLFITDLNQSPFNVGTRLILEDFTLEEVVELNRRYDSPLHDAEEVTRYFRLVGGNPYLVRRGLHAMATQRLDIGKLEGQAGADEGIFGDSLRRMLGALRQDVALCAAICAVLRGDPCPSSESFYRLRSAGVVIGDSAQDAQPRCGLYRTYLDRHLL